ncbi:unnamed protein product [Cylindrotheca closterium]|uniref:Mercuric reductase n=1 Tax=Cylindrotheca closterium TaxID=2856 RepID=A0AAD2JJR6_9STRA|nr:unnamed protein product [Cylindrotheca closterium]
MAVSNGSWSVGDADQEEAARKEFEIWPLDESNVKLLNQVHPRTYKSTDEPPEVYDLIAIGAGAGGLVSSKQAGRRGAKSAMISEKLAGGDCLNVGCVPSKALIRSARAMKEVSRAAEFGIHLENVKLDFGAVMKRVRELRAKIAPVDGHEATEAAGTNVFQGRGRLTGPNTLEVNGQTLRFKVCVLATGGRPAVPKNIPGLLGAPYTTNEQLFNLQELPPRMVILGAGVIALEMAQSFALLGSKVTVVNRSSRLFASKGGDAEAAEILQNELEKDGVIFLSDATVSQVETIKGSADPSSFPLMKIKVADQELDCECLLVATGRAANIEDLGLEAAGVDFVPGKGISVNDFGQSVSNPSVYAVGDCVANVPRLTHMSGEMAKVVVQNGLAGDEWRLSSFVVPAVAYTEPEFATVGIMSQEQADKEGIEVDVYRAGLEHNDRAILESSNVGFVKIVTKKDSDEILGATIVADRAGDIINEISLAMKEKIGLRSLGRNIHSYPTTGEAVQGCGLQFINKSWTRFDQV